MWRQPGSMHAGFALEHAVISGFSGIHLEKLEIFSVSEVKGIPHDECHPAEECFSVCIALVQRRMHGPVKIHTVHHCFLLCSRSENVCGHLDFTFSLLPPPLVSSFTPVL